MLKHYYFDNSATTKTRKEVFSYMKRYFLKRYGNPSSAHKAGAIAKGSIEMAREKIARILNAHAGELVFTGSGSEANNTAIHSALKSQPHKKHIISSRIEHSSIFNTLEGLGEQGYEVTYIPVDKQGLYDLDSLKNSLREDTVLVSLSYANNEVGSVQCVDKICDIVKDSHSLLHLDAVQALPYIHMDLHGLGADYVTFSGHKIYAPKGVGLLYVKQNAPVSPLIHGGGQEHSLRSGTENVPYIMGFYKALALNKEEKNQVNRKLIKRRDEIIAQVLQILEGSVLTGHSSQRVPGIASFALKNMNSKKLVKLLAYHNIEISSGSACSSQKNIPSRILNALGYKEDYLDGSMRISIGKYNTPGEIKYLLKMLKKVADQLRQGVTPISNNEIISNEELRKLIEEKEEFQIIDIRALNSNPMQLPNVIAIPFYRLKQSLHRIDKEKEVVLVCYDGDLLSPIAQSLLNNRGYRKVNILSGGFNGMNLNMGEEEIGLPIGGHGEQVSVVGNVTTHIQ